MILNFKENNSGFGIPNLKTEEDVEKLEGLLDKIYNIQPELMGYSVFLNYNGLDFDIDDDVDIDEMVYEILDDIECKIKRG